MKKIIVSLALTLFGLNVFAGAQWAVQSKYNQYDISPSKYDTFGQCDQFRSGYSHPNDYVCINASARAQWVVQSKNNQYDQSSKYDTYGQCEQFRRGYSHPNDYICAQQ